MNFINPPANAPRNVYHKTYFSKTLNREVGYNIYLPPDYKVGGESYPVAYHIHGWTGNESSEIYPLEKVYNMRRAITVFINAVSSEEKYFDSLLQIEFILLNEVIPLIENEYRADNTPESRMLSGFSMGGNMAFYYAVKHPEIFGSVTAYAGTYHHLYNKEYRTVGIPKDKISKMYSEMLKEKWYLEENNILCLVRENADKIRERLKIELRIGTEDILLCDNEIMHLYMESLNIPHAYIKFEGAAHELAKIV